MEQTIKTINHYFENKIAVLSKQKETSLSLAKFLNGRKVGSKFTYNDIECMITEVELRENAYFLICPMNSAHNIGNGDVLVT